MKNLLDSLKVAALTVAICCVAYPLAVLAFARAYDAEAAEGNLVRNEAGDVVGSRLIAQAFSSPRYFWPRPSAADFNAQAAGGSNLAPTNPALAERAREILGRVAAPPGTPVPADLVTASGSGLDPHISAPSARLQAARVAQARNLAETDVQALIDGLAFSPGARLAPDPVVNVLELNLALDNLSGKQ